MEADTDFFIEIILFALVMVEIEAATARFDASARLEDASIPSAAAALRAYWAALDDIAFAVIEATRSLV